MISLRFRVRRFVGQGLATAGPFQLLEAKGLWRRYQSDEPTKKMQHNAPKSVGLWFHGQSPIIGAATSSPNSVRKFGISKPPKMDIEQDSVNFIEPLNIATFAEIQAMNRETFLAYVTKLSSHKAWPALNDALAASSDNGLRRLHPKVFSTVFSEDFKNNLTEDVCTLLISSIGALPSYHPAKHQIAAIALERLHSLGRHALVDELSGSILLSQPPQPHFDAILIPRLAAINSLGRFTEVNQEIANIITNSPTISSSLMLSFLPYCGILNVKRLALRVLEDKKAEIDCNVALLMIKHLIVKREIDLARQLSSRLKNGQVQDFSSPQIIEAACALLHKESCMTCKDIIDNVSSFVQLNRAPSILVRWCHVAGLLTKNTQMQAQAMTELEARKSVLWPESFFMISSLNCLGDISLQQLQLVVDHSRRRVADASFCPEVGKAATHVASTIDEKECNLIVSVLCHNGLANDALSYLENMEIMYKREIFLYRPVMEEFVCALIVCGMSSEAYNLAQPNRRPVSFHPSSVHMFENNYETKLEIYIRDRLVDASLAIPFPPPSQLTNKNIREDVDFAMHVCRSAKSLDRSKWDLILRSKKLDLSDNFLAACMFDILGVKFPSSSQQLMVFIDIMQLKPQCENIDPQTSLQLLSSCIQLIDVYFSSRPDMGLSKKQPATSKLCQLCCLPIVARLATIENIDASSVVLSQLIHLSVKYHLFGTLLDCLVSCKNWIQTIQMLSLMESQNMALSPFHWASVIELACVCQKVDIGLNIISAMMSNAEDNDKQRNLVKNAFATIAFTLINKEEYQHIETLGKMIVNHGVETHPIWQVYVGISYLQLGKYNEAKQLYESSIRSSQVFGHMYKRFLLLLRKAAEERSDGNLYGLVSQSYRSLGGHEKSASDRQHHY